MGNVTLVALTAALTTVVSYFLGYAAAKGFIPVAGVGELSTALVVLIMAGVSWWFSERATRVRETAAVNAGIKESNKEQGITPPVPDIVAQSIIAINAPPKEDAPIAGQASS
jgi:hypothetical protein